MGDVTGGLWPEAPVLAAWLLTFAVHSTALLGVLWLAGRWLTNLTDPVQEALVKFALVASLCSATLQVVLGAEPAAGHLATVVGANASTALPPAAVLPPAVLPPTVSPPDFAQLLLAGMNTGSPVESVAPPAMNWSAVLVGGAALAAVLGLLMGLRLRFGLWRILRRRRPVSSGPTVVELRKLQRLAGLRRRVRLSVCDALQTPIAFGILRPEICLPPRALRELDAEEHAGMLAHELAHVVRRDPLWLSATELLERLFPWQPMFRLARKRLRELAEYRCDAWAARLVGGLPLAGCLLKVAEWVARPQAPMRLVPGMAQQGSNLRGRIDRLLEGSNRERVGLHRLWLPPVCAALLLAMTTVLPGATWDRSSTAPEPVDGLQEPMPLVSLEEEHAALRAEVAALWSELPSAPDLELILLMDELDRRLSSFETRRARLLTLLAQIAGDKPGGEPTKETHPPR